MFQFPKKRFCNEQRLSQGQTESVGRVWALRIMLCLRAGVDEHKVPNGIAVLRQRFRGTPLIIYLLEGPTRFAAALARLVPVKIALL